MKGLNVIALFVMLAVPVIADDTAERQTVENQRLRQLVMEQIKTISELRDRIVALERENAELRAQIDTDNVAEKTSVEEKPEEKPAIPPQTFAAIAKLTAKERENLVGAPTFGSIIITKVEPITKEIYQFTGFDTAREYQRIGGGQENRDGVTRRVNGRDVKIRVILEGSEETALRVEAFYTEMNITGTITKVETTKFARTAHYAFDTESVTLWLQDVRAR